MANTLLPIYKDEADQPADPPAIPPHPLALLTTLSLVHAAPAALHAARCSRHSASWRGHARGLKPSCASLPPPLPPSLPPFPSPLLFPPSLCSLCPRPRTSLAPLEGRITACFLL
ncbi:uncharacterized protein SCHCODRAFT_0106692, partial [Schizophyllum commune H4-8]|uniref:uncharacterized protein n=1 Tax=Schizophyllum commune (strain H4-8 / FGSC 9210) TaxID=578458 RepID=UPI00215FAA54